MTIKIRNSATGIKTQFVPIDDNRVTMYSCGPTVYSYAHIGNMRAAVSSDIVYRVLLIKYGEDSVVYSRNITDIDDKIITAADNEGVSIFEISEKYRKIYEEDVLSLNCLNPNKSPKATDYVQQMIEMISLLIEKGHAYESNGHVFFDVESNPNDLMFSKHVKTEDRISRIDPSVFRMKRSKEDFVLWKPSKGTDVGWNSPFGYGRMGWHIECSSMIKSTLGETIDIHCGGIDLKFPHHENEIAQSQCAHDKPLSNFWIHNEFVNIDGGKIAKSSGNSSSARDVIEEWGGEVVRLGLISSHYKKPIEWSDDILSKSKSHLDRWYDKKLKFPNIKIVGNDISDFKEALFDDFNVPKAISVVHKYEKMSLFGKMIQSLNLIGLLLSDASVWFKGDVDEQKIQDMVDLRVKMKLAKDWDAADKIREDLSKLGVSVEDKGAETIWKVL